MRRVGSAVPRKDGCDLGLEIRAEISTQRTESFRANRWTSVAAIVSGAR